MVDRAHIDTFTFHAGLGDGGDASWWVRRRYFQDMALRQANAIVNPPLILEHPTVVLMKRVRRERAERLRALRLRPWWRKVWDGVAYVVTGREP